MREAEMADLKKQVEEINDAACSIARFDPLTEDSSKAASSSSTAAVVCEATPELASPAAGEPPAAVAAPPEPSPPEPLPMPAAPSAPGEVGSGNRPA
jgi:sec-independent protein translocase protein TatB